VTVEEIDRLVEGFPIAGMAVMLKTPEYKVREIVAEQVRKVLLHGGSVSNMVKVMEIALDTAGIKR
jgi:hypothetical protein